MDYELWLKLGARFEVRHVDRVLAAYRYHPVSKSVADYDEFWPETGGRAASHGGRFFSPMYTDYYLPRYRPHLYRLLLATRLAARRATSAAGQSRGSIISRRRGGQASG